MSIFDIFKGCRHHYKVHNQQPVFTRVFQRAEFNYVLCCHKCYKVLTPSFTYSASYTPQYYSNPNDLMQYIMVNHLHKVVEGEILHYFKKLHNKGYTFVDVIDKDYYPHSFVRGAIEHLNNN